MANKNAKTYKYKKKRTLYQYALPVDFPIYISLYLLLFSFSNFQLFYGKADFPLYSQFYAIANFPLRSLFYAKAELPVYS